MNVVIEPEVLLDGTTGRPTEASAVWVAAGRIAAVGPAADIRRQAPTGITVLQAPGATLIPGLIDAHVHLAWGLPDQTAWPRVAATPEGQAAWALGGAQAALAAGVTTQRDCGGPGLVSVRVRDALASGVVGGPRLMVCGPCVTTTAGHGDFIGVTADTRDEIVRRVRELCATGVDAIKLMASGGDMDPHTNRRAPQYSDDQLTAAVADAHRLGLPVVAHCNATAAIRQAVAAHVDTIAHCNWLGEQDGTIEYDPRTAAQMVAQGTYVDLNVEATLTSYAGGDGWAMPLDIGPTNRWELHEQMRLAGGRLLFSSDQFGHRTANFPGLLARAVDELGVDVAEVIHRATAVPAAALRLDDQVGQVLPGLRADLVLVDGDLRADASALTRPARIWQDGTDRCPRTPTAEGNL
jgi:imidazolonepropionase-like amidohydrolase